MGAPKQRFPKTLESRLKYREIQRGGVSRWPQTCGGCRRLMRAPHGVPPGPGLGPSTTIRSCCTSLRGRSASLHMRRPDHPSKTSILPA